MNKQFGDNVTIGSSTENILLPSCTENKATNSSKPDWEPSQFYSDKSSTISSNDVSQRSYPNPIATASDSSSSKYFDSPLPISKNVAYQSNIRPSTSSVSSASSIFSGASKPQSLDDEGLKGSNTEKGNISSLWTTDKDKMLVNEETDTRIKTDDFIGSANTDQNSERLVSSKWEQFTNMLAGKTENESIVTRPDYDENNSTLLDSGKKWVTFDDEDVSGGKAEPSRTSLIRRNTTVGVSKPSEVFKNPFSPAESPTATTSTNPFSTLPNKARSNTLDPQAGNEFRRHSANPFSFSDNTVVEESNDNSSVTASTTNQNNATFFADFTSTNAADDGYKSRHPETAAHIDSYVLSSQKENNDIVSVSKDVAAEGVVKPQISENASTSNATTALPQPIDENTATDTEDEVGDQEIVPFYESSLKRFDMLLRVPEKKRKIRSRKWKKIVVGLEGPKVKLYEVGGVSPYTEVSLQGCCCLTKPKIGRNGHEFVHVIKLRLISYKEVRRVSGKFEKVLHKNTIFKFGVTSYSTLIDFTQAVQNILFQMPEYRSVGITYQKEKITLDVFDESRIWLSNDGNAFYSHTTVRIMALAFVSGMTSCTIELNDQKAKKQLRQGETGGGKSIAAMSKNELASLASIRGDKSWINTKNRQFHCCVDRKTYFKNAIIEFKPVDGSEFELMRFDIPQSKPFEKIYPPVGNRTADISCVLPILATVDLQNDGHHVQVSANISLPENTNPYGSIRQNVRLIIPIPQDWRPLFSEHKNVVKGRNVQPLKVVHNKNCAIPHNLKKSIRSVIAINGGSVKHKTEFGGIVWDIGTMSAITGKSATKYKLLCQTSLLPSMELPNDYSDPPRALLEFSLPFSHASGIIVRSVKIGHKTQPEKCITYTSHYRYFIDMIPTQHSIDNDNAPLFSKRPIDYGCFQQ